MVFQIALKTNLPDKPVIEVHIPKSHQILMVFWNILLSKTTEKYSNSYLQNYPRSNNIVLSNSVHHPKQETDNHDKNEPDRHVLRFFGHYCFQSDVNARYRKTSSHKTDKCMQKVNHNDL